MPPCPNEIETQKSAKNQPMKNGSSEHNFDLIAELLRRQNAVFELLVHHLAYVEATVSTLLVKTLRYKDKEEVHKMKKLRDHILPKINDKMEAELERNLEDC